MSKSYVLLFEEFNAAEEKAKLKARLDRVTRRNTRNKERLSNQKNPERQAVSKLRLDLDKLDLEKIKIQNEIVNKREAILKNKLK
jgi:hypothetical protein